MYQSIQLKKATPLFPVLFVLACFAISPRAQAVSPAPDGGYPGQNTAEGTSALLHLSGGTYNTALGWDALGFNVTGNFNTGVGAGTLLANTGEENTATGTGALLSNSTANRNTANGAFALFSNTTGVDNTAIGDRALFSNTTSNGNTAIGDFTLFSNVTGADNTAIGDVVLDANTTGVSNTAIGVAALASNTTGSSNIALGFNAGINLTTGGNNIDIGNPGATAESNTIRIGVQGTQAFTIIAGISNDMQAIGTQVIVTTDGFLGVQGSSARFKDEIKPMDKASGMILALKPVTFRYKKEIDPRGTPQFGLVAEDVEKVNPDLVVRGKDGKPYSVRYDQVNAMLLNEFLKEHRKVQELEANAARQQKQIETLTAGLQKVSAQLEVSNPAPQTVLNNQ
jgi:hypothetical protein